MNVIEPLWSMEVPEPSRKKKLNFQPTKTHWFLSVWELFLNHPKVYIVYITNSEVCTVLAHWHNSRLTCWLQLVNIWASSAVPWEALAAVFLFLIMGHAETKRCVCVWATGFPPSSHDSSFPHHDTPTEETVFFRFSSAPRFLLQSQHLYGQRVAAPFPTRWYFCGSSFSSSEFECESHGPFSYGTWVLHKYLLFPFWILRASKVFFLQPQQTNRARWANMDTQVFRGFSVVVQWNLEMQAYSVAGPSS